MSVVGNAHPPSAFDYPPTKLTFLRVHEKRVFKETHFFNCRRADQQHSTVNPATVGET
jgi:hypothetical protein